MPRKQVIPAEIQEEVLKTVEEFNREHFSGEIHPLITALFGSGKRGFAARFKGKFLYLDRTDRGRPLKFAVSPGMAKWTIGVLPSIATRAISMIPMNGCFQARNM